MAEQQPTGLFESVRLCLSCRHHINPLHFEEGAYPGPCAKHPGLTARRARDECRGLHHEPIEKGVTP